MTTHHITIVQLGDFVCKELQKCCDFLNEFDLFKYYLQEVPIDIGAPDYVVPGIFSEYSFIGIADYLKDFRKERGVSPNKPVLAVINRAIEKNHFAHTDHDERFAVISLSSSQELLTDISNFEYLSFELAQHAMAIVYKAFTHREPKGCFFDFCGDKRDAINIFKNGDFCKSCKMALNEEPRSYLAAVWSALEARKKEVKMPIDPNIVGIALSSISALSALVSAAESTVNLSKEARLKKANVAENAEKLTFEPSTLTTLAQLSDNNEEQEIITLRIDQARTNLKEALRNGSREEEAKALDVAASEICRALNSLKRLNHGVLPDDLYPLWTRFNCR